MQGNGTGRGYSVRRSARAALPSVTATGFFIDSDCLPRAANEESKCQLERSSGSTPQRDSDSSHPKTAVLMCSCITLTSTRRDTASSPRARRSSSPWKPDRRARRPPKSGQCDEFVGGAPTDSEEGSQEGAGRPT